MSLPIGTWSRSKLTPAATMPPAAGVILRFGIRARKKPSGARMWITSTSPVPASRSTHYSGPLTCSRQRSTATPSWIIDRLNAEITAGLADAKLKARLTELGSVSFAGSPFDFGKHLASETEKGGEVIRTANIKPE